MEFEVVARPGSAGVDEAEAHAVAAESPARVCGDAGSDRLTPCGGQRLVVSDDECGRLRSAFAADPQRAPSAVIRALADVETQKLHQGNDDALRHCAQARSRPERVALTAGRDVREPWPAHGGIGW